jgi:hypothetical protein
MTDLSLDKNHKKNDDANMNTPSVPRYHIKHMDLKAFECVYY